MSGHQSYLPMQLPGNFGYPEAGGSVLAYQPAAYLYLSTPPPPLPPQPKYRGCSEDGSGVSFTPKDSNNSALVQNEDCGGGGTWKFEELTKLLRSQPVWSDPCLGEGSSDSSAGYEPENWQPESRQPTPRPVTTTTARNDKEAVWTGTMPARVYKNARFSQKLFVGGLPLTVKSGELQKSFGVLGNVRVILPKARNQAAANQINGYCHIVVKDGKSVKRLLSRCHKNIDNPDDSLTRIVQSYDYFYELQLNSTMKKVQVIPWCINDSSYTNHMNGTSEKHVVFVGALHGIMTAEFLGRVMSDLFGNIEFVTLDTDRFDYPIGSAQVGFTSRDSYLKALKTNFVKIKTCRFTKVVQIEPYLEDSACSLCAQCIGVNFCKSDMCFRYYCSQCWERVHACLDRHCMLEHQRLKKKRQEEAE